MGHKTTTKSKKKNSLSSQTTKGQIVLCKLKTKKEKKKVFAKAKKAKKSK